MTLSETHIHNPNPPISDFATKLARAAGWTEKQEDDLRTLVDGREHSFNEIGSLLGKSRSAISRRIKSLGIELPENFQTVQMVRGRWATEWKPGRQYQRPGRAPKPAPKLVIVEFLPENFIESNVLGIDALQPHHCRFICNDDMAAPVFCGLPMMENSKFSYCAGHHRICTKPILEGRSA